MKCLSNSNREYEQPKIYLYPLPITSHIIVHISIVGGQIYQ